MIDVSIFNETDSLQSVIIGKTDGLDETIEGMFRLAEEDPASIDENFINPKAKEIYRTGKKFSSEAEVKPEIDAIASTLAQQGISIFRPDSQLVPGEAIVFPRDLGFVIGNRFVLANLKHRVRDREKLSIKALVHQMEHVEKPPKDAWIEGGDILLWQNKIFVGFGPRTNMAGVDWLKQTFSPYFEVLSFELLGGDNPKIHSIHLDCAFNIVGEKTALFYLKSFRSQPTALLDLLTDRILITDDEFYHMATNLLSLSPAQICIGARFKRLAKELAKRGIEPIPLQTDRLTVHSGSLRCASLPLCRRSK